MENDEEKYRELYNLSKEVLKEDHGRFQRLDEKASRHLSVISLLLGACAFFGRLLIDDLLPPRAVLEWLLVSLGAVILFGLLASWTLTFGVLRQRPVRKITVDSRTIKFFEDNSLLDIYLSLTKGNKDALEENLKTTDRKSKSLLRSYCVTRITMWLFILFSLVFVVQRSRARSTINNKEGSAVMPKGNSQDPKPPKPPEKPPGKPDPSVKPPTYITVMEDIHDAGVQKKQGGGKGDK